MLGALAYFLFIYVLGGLTLIPAVVLLLFRMAKVHPEDGELEMPSNDEAPNVPDELEKEEETGVDSFMTAWITVSRDYFVYPAGDPKNSQIPPLQAANDASMQQNEGAYSKLYTLMSNSHKAQQKETKQVVESESTSIKKNSPSNLKKYFAVLKHGNILLYLDSDQAKLKYVIVIANHVVSIWPPNTPDGELFIKRTAICLAKKNSVEGFDMLLNYDATKSSPKDAFYIYSDSCTEKEDFYFAIIRAAKQSESTQGLAPAFDPTISAVPYHYKTNEMMDLIVKLHSSDANLQTRWLNAILGRLFLAVKGTGFFEKLVEEKLIKKLSRVKKPGFLGKLEVKKVAVGNSIPLFTSPKLRDLTPEGLLIVDANISYGGGLSVEIATKMILNLGAHFKTRDVSLLLSATLDSLEGKLQLKIKPPPSNRLWFGFETMPKLNFHVEPVVSSKQITYSMITNAIENRIREVFKETLVLPNMDDISFSNTEEDFYRGGIWDRSVRNQAMESDTVDESVKETDDVSSADLDDDQEETDDASSIFGTSSKLGKKLTTKSSSFLKKTTSSLTASSSTSDLIGGRAKNSSQFLKSSRNSKASNRSSKDTFGSDRSDSDHERENSQSPVMSPQQSNISTPKKDIMNTMKKWGTWYFKDKQDKQEPQQESSRESPAIAQQHRRRSSTSAKVAPLPHNFPPEIMRFLREEKLQESTRSPYGRMDMQIPPNLQPNAHSAPKKTNTVLRKPVGSGDSKKSTAVPITNTDQTTPELQQSEILMSSSASSESMHSNHSGSTRMPNVSFPTGDEDSQGILLRPTTAAPVVNPSPANSSPTFDPMQRGIGALKKDISGSEREINSPTDDARTSQQEDRSESIVSDSDETGSISSAASELLDSTYLDEVDPSASIIEDPELLDDIKKIGD